MTWEGRKPDFFIVGAPKCGTTAMADYLGQHPEIYLPEAKDSQYFGKDIKVIHRINQPPDLFKVEESTYHSWFAGRDEKRMGEASVFYLSSQYAPEEIRAFNPAGDIIVMLRNPVEVIRSLHNHCVSTLNEDIENLEEALEAEPDRRAGKRIPATTYLVNALFYREVVKFSSQIERYQSIFGREKVHVIIFDDFRSDPRAVFRETVRFLGVEERFSPEIRVVNPARQLRSRRVQRFIVDPPAPLRAAGEALSRVGWVRNLVRQGVLLLNVSHRRPEPMDSALKARLTRELESEVSRLGSLLGRDLSHWSRS